MGRDTGSVCEVVVVGTDGTDSGDQAVEYALSFAEQYGSTLHVLSVADTDRHGEPALSSRELLTVDAEERAREQLREVKARATAQGLDLAELLSRRAGPGAASLRRGRRRRPDGVRVPWGVAGSAGGRPRH